MDEVLCKKIGIAKKELRLLDKKLNEMAKLVHHKREQGILNAKLENSFAGLQKKIAQKQNTLNHLEKMYEAQK